MAIGTKESLQNFTGQLGQFNQNLAQEQQRKQVSNLFNGNYDPEFLMKALLPLLGTNPYAAQAFKGVSSLEPQYQYINQEGGGLQQIKKVPGQEPEFKQITPTATRPQAPTQASLAQDAADPNSPTAKQSQAALDAMREKPSKYQFSYQQEMVNGKPKTVRYFSNTEDPKDWGFMMGGEPIPKGVSGNVVKLVKDGSTGKATFKLFRDIQPSDEPLSTQALNTGEWAQAATSHIPNIRQEISDLDARGKLGPVLGRWNAFMTGQVGAGDADYNEFRANLSLLKSALMRAHTGARGGQYLLSKFDEMLSADKMDAKTLEGGLNSAEEWLSTYAKMGGKPTEKKTIKLKSGKVIEVE